MKRAVITGATGAIGTALVQELICHGIECLVLCREGSARNARIPDHPLVHKMYYSLDRLAELKNESNRPYDVFYHFAWANTIGPGRNDMPSQINNIRYTIDAVRCAHALGCKVFIGAGSQAEYGRVEGLIKPETPCFPENGYGIAKLSAGYMSRIECQKYGIDHIWTRILSIYGPGDGSATMISSVIRQLLAGKKPALTEGVQMWDYLYSGDAAKAFRLLAEHGINGKTYVLGSGTARPLREYIELLRDSIDPSLPLGFGEIPYGPLQVMHLQADISELQKDTGFAPEVPFEVGIQHTINSIKEMSK